MADTPPPSIPTHHLVMCALIAVTQLLAGVFINGFILVVNVADFIRQRHVAPLDLLVCCLITSRISFQLFNFLINLALLSLVTQSVFQEFNVIIVFVNIWGLWLATWLSVFYCTKITNIPHTLFYWIKVKIPKLVPWLILGSTVYAAVSTGMQGKHTYAIIQKLLVNTFSSNVTQTKIVDVVPLSVFTFHLIVPLMIFLLATLFLVFSLGRHAHQMRTLTMVTRDPRCSAPIRALLSVLSFLMLYLTYYIISLVFSFQHSRYGRIFTLFLNFLFGTYPPIHSVILILGNPRLKQSARKFFLYSQCGQRGASVSVERI